MLFHGQISWIPTNVPQASRIFLRSLSLRRRNSRAYSISIRHRYGHGESRSERCAVRAPCAFGRRNRKRYGTAGMESISATRNRPKRAVAKGD